MPKQTAKTTRKAVVVTTEFKGVFFGYVVADNSPANIVLAHARMCVSWSSQVRGVVGLAVSGPVNGSKVTAAVPKVTLQKVTAVFVCTPEASAAWEKAPWN